MSANNKNQKAVDRLLYPVVGGKIGVRDFLEDEGMRSYIDFGQYDYITKEALNGFNPLPQVLDITLSAGGPDIYTLTAPELAIVNSYNRYPNFVAVIAATGEYAPDIVPLCLGIAGGFTSVSIRLHSDGAGNNPDDTIVQFS